MMEPLDFEGVTGALRAELPDLGAFLAILGAGTYLKYRVPGRELAAQKVPARTWVLTAPPR